MAAKKKPAARTAHKPLRPFTVDHFRKYTSLLVLDNGERWDLEDFQAEVAADVFAGIREVWMVVPEGNGKTTFMAGFSLYHADFTPSANVLWAAASRDQCGLLLGQAAGFVYRTPGLLNRFQVYEGYRRVSAKRTGGRIQVFAADDRTGDGAIPTLALIDELHRHRDMRLYRTWRGKLDKRDGQILTISTAGEPGSDFEEARDRMRMLPEQTRVGCHLRASTPGDSLESAVIHDWSLRPTDNLDDVDLVKQANPFSGLTADKLAARRASPAMTPEHWARFVCNVPTHAEAKWIESRDGWDAGAIDPDWRPDDGEPIFIGLDPAWHHDTCAIVAVHPLEAGEDEEPRGFAWPLGIFKPQDEEGGKVPHWKVREAVLEAAARWEVQAIGYDRNRGFAQLAEELADEHGLPMIAVPMSGATWAPLTANLRAAVATGRILHPQDKTFTAQVLSGEVKASEQGPRLHGRTKAKVDALIALGMGWFVAFGTEGDTGISIYDSRGLL